MLASRTAQSNGLSQAEILELIQCSSEREQIEIEELCFEREQIKIKELHTKDQAKMANVVPTASPTNTKHLGYMSYMHN